MTDRRLAAILSADIEGYSRLMGDDEDATVKTLRSRREQVATLISEHRGTLADFTGDNFLALFPAALDAVTCALEIQRVNEALNQSLPEHRQMRFRIGAHLGDVREEDDRYFGEGVNVAARLQPLAQPGELCLSSTLLETIRGRLPLRLADLGDQTLKNIESPVHAWRALPGSGAVRNPRRRNLVVGAVFLSILAAAIALWTVSTESPPLAPSGSPAVSPIRSLAVLPLDNLSGDPKRAYEHTGT